MTATELQVIDKSDTRVLVKAPCGCVIGFCLGNCAGDHCTCHGNWTAVDCQSGIPADTCLMDFAEAQEVARNT